MRLPVWNDGQLVTPPLQCQDNNNDLIEVPRGEAVNRLFCQNNVLIGRKGNYEVKKGSPENLSEIVCTENPKTKLKD